MDGLVVYPKMIEKELCRNYLYGNGIYHHGMRETRRRQAKLHERIRQHSMEAGKQVKVEGKENDLIDRILADDYFQLIKNDCWKF